MLCYVMPCNVTLYCVVLCYVMLCYVMLCCYCVTSYHIVVSDTTHLSALPSRSPWPIHYCVTLRYVTFHYVTLFFV